MKINSQKVNRAKTALEKLSPHHTDCRLCPRECGVNRQEDDKGFCRIGNHAVVSTAMLHYGEEPALSGYADCRKAQNGKGGSGTIFFSGCNLRCLFCQNFQISWEMKGQPVTASPLADTMLDLQKQGALNINLVSPTHVLLPILEALRIAFAKGLHIPIVYNSNGYEKKDIIRQLEGIIDIYLPDMKYHSQSLSRTLSGAPDYFLHASSAITEMYCQQPRLTIDSTQTVEKGLIIRHLVLPGHANDSIRLLQWIASNLSTGISLSLMSQYQPCYKAPEEIQRRLFPEEYRFVVDKAQKLGFTSLFIQPEPFQKQESRIPDFRKPEPFQWD